jgi:hypothetical protein
MTAAPIDATAPHRAANSLWVVAVFWDSTHRH